MITQRLDDRHYDGKFRLMIQLPLVSDDVVQQS